MITMMKYYKDANNTVYAYDAYGTQDAFIKKGLVLVARAEAMSIINPPPGKSELIARAGKQKEMLINVANTYMNSKQWPGKAAIGRLKDAERVQYNLWLDYLDMLEAVDTSNAPGIEWPKQPVSQAS